MRNTIPATPDEVSWVAGLPSTCPGCGAKSSFTPVCRSGRTLVLLCTVCDRQSSVSAPWTSFLKKGERVWRYHDAGTHMELQYLTVVRVNRLTVTVRTDHGGQFRLPHEDIVRRVTPDEEEHRS